MSLFITIHYGDVLPLVSQVDNLLIGLSNLLEISYNNYFECEDFEFETRLVVSLTVSEF